MKSWPRAGLFFLSLVSVSALPIYLPDVDGYFSSIAEVHGRPDGTDHVVQVSIPCKECVADLDQDYFQFEIRLHAAKQECSARHSIALGHQTLPTTDWRHNTVADTYHFQSSPSTVNQASVDIASHVQLACLDQNTSLLSLRVTTISGQAVTSSNLGVTLSFTQLGQAQILRLVSNPIADVRLPGFDKVWGDRQHSAHDHGFQSRLDGEYRILQDLDEQLALLKEKRYRQEHKIGEMVIHEFASCSGISCYIQTATSKAPYLKQVLLTLFSHHHDLVHSEGSGAHGAGQVPWLHAELGDSEEPKTPSASIKDKDAKHDNAAEMRTHSTSDDSHEASLSGQSLDDKPSLPSSTSSPRPHYDGVRLMGASSDTYTRIHTRFLFFYSVTGVALFILVVLVMLKCANGQLNCCGDPRRKRDRAARREERRNRAAYKRAEFLHRIEQWWSGLRRPKATSNYDEKRTRILSQEGILEHAMQNEITTLGQAHELATDMVRADGERQRLHHEVNYGSSARPINIFHPAGHGESSSTRSIATLPLYPTPPPSYETELGDHMSILEGFSYPSSSEGTEPDVDNDSYSYSDNATESSVVDCNSRMSFETGSNGTRE